MATIPVPLDRVNILGVGVHAINMQDALAVIESTIQSGAKGYVCVTGVHGVMEAQHDSAFCDTLNQSLLTTPDGMPTVWVGKAYGHTQMERVYGPDLMLRVCELSVTRGYTHFLYGGAPGVADELKAALERRYPGIQIVGTYTPPFRALNADERVRLSDLVSASRPHLFWVGLSTPKQERFMVEYLPRLSTNVMLGVGAAFDIHTGRTREAPDWMKRSGLQWLHRLLQEPRRLGRRYLINNPAFAYHIARQLLLNFQQYNRL